MNAKRQPLLGVSRKGLFPHLVIFPNDDRSCIKMLSNPGPITNCIGSLKASVMLNNPLPFVTAVPSITTVT